MVLLYWISILPNPLKGLMKSKFNWWSWCWKRKIRKENNIYLEFMILFQFFFNLLWPAQNAIQQKWLFAFFLDNFQLKLKLYSVYMYIFLSSHEVKYYPIWNGLTPTTTSKFTPPVSHMSGSWIFWQPRLGLVEDSRTTDFRLGLLVLIGITIRVESFKQLSAYLKYWLTWQENFPLEYIGLGWGN